MTRNVSARGVALCFAVALHTSAAGAENPGFEGLLRARDLTPLGYLRLDMRPAHARSIPVGSWAMEAELAYQNTWALSPQVERYLTSLPGRRELGPSELQSIRDLPGENYLLDLELAQVDVTAHYQFSEHMGLYFILSGAAYDGGFLDGSIEQFHQAFGFSTFGRPALSRNDVNIVLDLKSMQYASFDAPTVGGLLDPTVGLRYSGLSLSKRSPVILEFAAKLPLRGRRSLLSSGRTDFGLQATLQHFFDSNAFYASVSTVYYAGTEGIAPSGSKVLPTWVLGFERKFTARTSAILQSYISPSIYERDETQLDELLSTKYQLSLGFRYTRGPSVFTFAVTENLQNINNTPDIGLQLGWAYYPDG